MKKTLSLICVLLAAALSPWLQAAPSKAPNIVILFADDLGYADLGSYGNPYIRTPNLDELAREGQRWTDFYVAAPVCSPSRGSLMTGQVPVRTGMYGQILPVMHPGDTHGFPADEVTIAEMLRDAGYATAMFGKWHLGDSPDHWPSRHGFDTWIGMPYSNDMDRTGEPTMTELLKLMKFPKEGDPKFSFANAIKRFHDPDQQSDWYNVPLYSSQRKGQQWDDETIQRPVDQTTITRRLTGYATDFIAANKDRSFFLYVPYSMPHLPVFASDSFKGKSVRGPYGDAVEELDWSAGEIRKALEKAGVADNTLLLFTSDNGPWQAVSTDLAGSAGVLNGAKGTTWEGGMRVPAVFWGPGLVKPATVSTIGSTLDMLATAAAMAGIDGAPTNDGVDLSGVLKNAEGSPRTVMPYYAKGQLSAYREGDLKIHFADPVSNKPFDKPRLYNLHRDIGEQRDIAEEQPEALAAMVAAAERYQQGVTVKPPMFDARWNEIEE